MKKIIDTLVMLLVSIVLPLMFKPHLLLTWPIWVVAFGGLFLSLSQPSMELKKEDADTYDRYSLWFIYIGAPLCFLIPVIDYAYVSNSVLNIGSRITILSLMLMILGLAFRYYSIRTLGKFFTTKVKIQNDHELIQIGPYKYLRHPSYSGSWVCLLGVSVFLQSKYGIAFCVLIYLPIYIYRISCEEKALLSKFSEKYITYQKTTWKMFPFLF